MVRRKQTRSTSRDLSLLAGLLILPVLALIRLATTLDWRLLISYCALISAVTFFVYWHDKSRAQSGGWRTPEANLHALELFGGWPGAFLAQRVFRHKTAKTSYQVVFWSIVALHQLASIDCLSGWRLSGKLLPMLAN